MARKTVVVPTEKEKIDRIKEKYNNYQMSDDSAKKIQKLEIANKILKGATYIVGAVTVIDWIIPDPVLGIDEAILTALTALLGTATKTIENKIDDIANTGDAELQREEAQKLGNQMLDVIQTIKEHKPNKTMNV